MEKVEWELVQQALMSTAHRSDPVVEFQYAYGHGSGGGGGSREVGMCMWLHVRVEQQTGAYRETLRERVPHSDLRYCPLNTGSTSLTTKSTPTLPTMSCSAR